MEDQSHTTFRMNNKNHAATYIIEQRGAQYFIGLLFPAAESYVTVTKILKTLILEEQWTYLN